MGSLLRPANLLDARAGHGAGQIDDAEPRSVEGTALSRDEQIAKPALIVETAEEVWG